MESEPKKPIEQMLEALAKARRVQFGDDAKMPNPMRARLHEEIARAEATDDKNVESRPSWITMFWPRVTVAAALATLLVLVPAIWWNQSHPLAERGQLAVRDRVAAASNQPNLATPSENTLAKDSALSATEPTVNLADNNQIKIEPAAGSSSESEASKSSTQVAQGRAATDSLNQPAKDFADKNIAAAKIQAAPAAAPAGGGDLKAKSDRMAATAPPVAQPSSAGNVAMTQQFSQQSAVRSFRNNAQANRAANVLNTFQVQQQGDEIRVLDADGSTYAGKIEQSTKSADVDLRAARPDAAKQTQAYAGKPARENESVAPQSYFRATGYNVSLKKTVVFEGNYASPAVQQPATATSNDRQQAEQSRERARIVGTVRVNGEAPVEVDAIAETTESAPTKKSEK